MEILQLLVIGGVVLLFFSSHLVLWFGQIGDRTKIFLGRLLPRSRNAPPTSIRKEPEGGIMVRQIEQGRAALMVRNDLTGHPAGCLIVWGGGLDKAYHDLGTMPGRSLGDEVVDEFTAIAAERIRQLATAETTTEAGAPSGATAEKPKDDETKDQAITMRRRPIVTRGKILQVGFMKRVTDEKEISQFGVRYRTDEGVEDVVWGVDLKRALAEANATVGDRVEILKVGRKVVEEGRAPMNLWKIARIG